MRKTQFRFANLQSIAKTKKITRKMRDSFFVEERYVGILKIHT